MHVTPGEYRDKLVKSKLAMIALTLGSLSNILLDYLFMGPFHMGVKGAALATGVGPILSVILLLPHFFSKKNALHFSLEKIRFRDMGHIIRLGFPSFLMEFTIGIVTFFYNESITWNGYGEVGLAAYLLIGYLMLIFLTIFLGFSEGLQPVFSHFEGRARKKEARSYAALALCFMPG